MGGNVNDRERQICERAVKAYGVSTQLDMVVEEMAELTKAIMKWRRGQAVDPAGSLLKEIMREGVDVQLMLMQVQTLFPSDDWQLEKYGKLTRLQAKLDKKGA